MILLGNKCPLGPKVHQHMSNASAWSKALERDFPFRNLCVTPDLTSPDMTGYTLDSTAGAWPQHVTFTLPRYLFTNLGFPECLYCIEYNIYPRLCHDYGLMIFD